MSDAFAWHQSGLTSPASRAAAVTPNDAADLVAHARALWVGGLGNVAVVTVGGDTVTFTGVSGLLPVRVKRVLETGTTATGIVAVW